MIWVTGSRLVLEERWKESEACEWERCKEKKTYNAKRILQIKNCTSQAEHKEV